MKIKTLSLIATSVLLAFATSCSNEDVIQSAGNAENKTVGNKEDANLTTFVSGVGTRTSMDPNNGHFFWEKNDRIYVKDDGGEFKRSTNAVTESKQAAFKFMMPGVYKASDKYMVYYPGEDGKNDQVTIDNGQYQKLPNNNSHFGTSGDCGMAYGIKSPKNQFDFELVHKAAYLCFEPFTSHELVSTYVSRIEVTSDNEIAGKYTLTLYDSGETKLERADGNHYNSITLKLGADDDYFEGFQISKDISKWKAYMVIYPGTHKLTIKYHVIDTQTKVQGDITKTLKSQEYAENTYYNIDSKLDVYAIDKKVYLWDAKEDCWYGYADEQPALPSDKGTHYPTASDQLRWHSTANINYEGTTGGTPAVNEPTKSCPNVNETLWYIFNGEPHWDSDKLWTTLKHLYKGGVWIKKKQYISDFSSTGFKKKGESSYDYRNPDVKHQKLFDTPWSKNNEIKSITQYPLSKQDKKKYFFLPAFEGICGTNGKPGTGVEIGKIRGGAGRGMGAEGMYWTSTSYNMYHASHGAFQLGIKADHLGIYRSDRRWGLKCVAFE